MNINEFQNVFEQECQKNGLEFSEEKAEKLFEYMKLILEWNEKINVTAVKDELEFVEKHFIDTLKVNQLLQTNSERILDIGTGAGIPGIPLKIYYPEKKFTLIDAVNKKVNVVNDVIEKLKLDKIEALHIRAEDLAQDVNYREQFDIVITRAVSKLVTISEYMLPFLKIGGTAICMKGPNIEEEIKTAEKAISVLGGKIEKIQNFMINDEFERNLIVIKKIRKTENKYPRKQGKPEKEPIK